jgi:hypothetical protein
MCPITLHSPPSDFDSCGDKEGHLTKIETGDMQVLNESRLYGTQGT